MSSTKRISSDDTSPAKCGGPSPKRSKPVAARPAFFFVAGSRGTLPVDKGGEPPLNIKTLLSTVCHATGQMEKPPPGMYGCNENALAKLHTAVIAFCAEHPGRDVWLVTQSFGGRLAVHTTIRGVENRGAGGKPKPWTEDRKYWPAAVRGIIAFGYPLHHETQNRAAPLLEMAKETRVLFVMGQNDQQSLGKPINRDLLSNTIARMPNLANVQVLWTRGHHNPLHVPKKERQASNENILEAVRAFIAAPQPTPGPTKAPGDMSVKELKAVLEDKGISLAGCVEKQKLVAKVKAALGTT